MFRKEQSCRKVLLLVLAICAASSASAYYGSNERYYGRGYGSRYGRNSSYRGFGSSIGGVRSMGRGGRGRGYGGGYDDIGMYGRGRLLLADDAAEAESPDNAANGDSSDTPDPGNASMDLTQTPEYAAALNATKCPISIRDLGPTIDKYTKACKDVDSATVEDFCLSCVNPVKTAMQRAMYDLSQSPAPPVEPDEAQQAAMKAAQAALHTDIGEQVTQDRCGMDVVNYMEAEGVPIDDEFNEKTFMCLTFTSQDTCPKDMDEVIKPLVAPCQKTVKELYELHTDMRYNPATDNTTVDTFCSECYWPFITDAMDAGATDGLLCQVQASRDNDTSTWSTAEMDKLTGIIYDYDGSSDEGVKSVLGCLRAGRAAMRSAASLTDPLAPHLTTEIRSRCWDLDAVNAKGLQDERLEEGLRPFWDRVTNVECPAA